MNPAHRDSSAVLLDASPANIRRAADCLRRGELVAFPTETVYGLGADATNDEAVARIFSAKERPRFNPLIIHCADVGRVRTQGIMDERAEKLASAFWPGPLTLVLPRHERANVSLLACAGLDTVALRIPGHKVALDLLRETGRPLAAPSANPSGTISPTRAAHVAEGLKHGVSIILDGGACLVGLESTVIDLSGTQALILRPGAITQSQIESVLGPLPAGASAPGPARSPGLLKRHYAPRHPLRLQAHDVKADEALLAFGPTPLAGAAVMRNLSPRGDLKEAAANLFAMLRELDRCDISAIVVMPVPDDGLGTAINDRLTRAAQRDDTEGKD